MRRFITSVFILLVLTIAFSGCYSSRKRESKLTSLMLQDNTRLGRNKAYYSRHNVKTKKDTYRKFRRNRRHR